VLYGGNPNDPSGVPHPLASYGQSFDSGPLPGSWTMPEWSSASWAIDSGTSFTGSKSLRSGAVNYPQNSTIRFRAFFAAGQLSFYTKADPGGYGDRLIVLVDGTYSIYLNPTAQWTKQTIPITLGIHNVEWRYERDNYNAVGTHAVWIDDVAFGP